MEKLAPDPDYPTIFRTGIKIGRLLSWLYKIYLTTPEKSNIHQQTPNSLPILFPQRGISSEDRITIRGSPPFLPACFSREAWLSEATFYIYHIFLYRSSAFGSVPAKVKALCCFGPILGDDRLNAVWVGPIYRSSYAKSCLWQALSRLCGLRHCRQ